MTQQHEPHPAHEHTAEAWDERYRSQQQLFSGNPNGVLVTDVADLPPGQALDVGCGEGGDAIWLARRGWQVTAIDISRVALQRGAAAAHAASAESGSGGSGNVDVAEHISWVHGDPTSMAPPADTFDLVSVHYFPLKREPGDAALRGLLAAVAPGGTLLYVSHDIADVDPSFEPHLYYQPGEVAELLGDDWTIEDNALRARTTPPPEGTHHHNDVVLRARRTA
ncbi:SAM-dependent methyltransferase [Saccharomonospora sp. CUA-673]|uniref:class I SAM-dependent methyltransferase n=1 Tax=Saccharomonospora sp. CUA-673 TaxID=1904969 RepID=UPI00095DABD2|nr:class I SAM-dependent methyltransferase [Saccharomonospora sp. CUA-673]OLT40683.1 SAM-dependent methyltransferase [Saccharomonospora sp. CUA-673]